ncbi:hypothetical protein [Alteromonas sp. a30]|uniref:hypothetical protein n=1 Tax=Alteromonas sp. a30 TaxID=2730917 RepID=UPI0022817533|nr:hypothetical protein [Alteromonas sp. a30]MCY7297267.1 hypothetical protein [Alteromonas sp. a30]
MRYEKLEMEQAYAKLSQNERPLLGFVAALFGYIPATAILMLFSENVIFASLAAGLICPAIIAVFARFVGRLFRTQGLC